MPVSEIPASVLQGIDSAKDASLARVVPLTVVVDGAGDPGALLPDRPGLRRK